MTTPHDPLDDFDADTGDHYDDDFGDVADYDPRTEALADHPANDRYTFGRASDLDGGEDIPTVLTRTDGQALLYPAAVNLFAGEPGSCKSWLAQHETARRANAGAHVIYADYESTYRSVMRRLKTVGLRDDSRTRVHYPKHLGKLTPKDVAMLADYARALEADFIVIDGIAEALAAHGLTEDKAGEYAQWHAEVARALARAAAACVLLLDHVPKPVSSRAHAGTHEPDLYPRGSGHKLAAIDGAAYMLSMVEPLSRANPGVVELTIAKDREGYVGPKRWRAARVTLTPENFGAELYMSIDPPPYAGRPAIEDPARRASVDPKLTDDFLRDVLDAVTRASRRGGGPIPTRKVSDELRASDVKFSDKLVTPALIRLVDRHDLEATAGPRRATLYAPPPRQTTMDG